MVSALSVMDGGGVGNGDVVCMCVCVSMRMCVCVWVCRYMRSLSASAIEGRLPGRRTQMVVWLVIRTSTFK